MTNGTKHISVCICTYRRPRFLKRLFEKLGDQEANGLFTYSIVVVDNDHLQSAKPVVWDAAATSSIPIQYYVEPRQNIALARNKAIENANGDFVAFIDDDEEPSREWLIRLIEAIERYGADGVLGPVVPRFLVRPPEWIARGRFFNRDSPVTGSWLQWRQTRTGNVLFRRRIFDDGANRFRPEYGRGSEDSDFFRRMIGKGMRFVWCAEATVHEVVPQERCRHSYLLKRALLRGRAPYNQGWPVVISLVAVPAYGLVLPFLLLFGHHVFMRYLIRECDHLGRILAFLGFDVVREWYVK